MYKGKFTNNPEAALAQAAKKPSRGTVLFYSIYTAVIVIFFIAMGILLAPLKDWLVRYEASQPQQKSQEVFQDLFAEPDWAALYELAEIEDTKYEGKEAFAAYMEEFALGKAITYIETSAGLSGDHKYIVRLDDKKIGTFTLTGGNQSQTEIPQWELGEVELLFTRDLTVTIEKLPGYTVCINGVALDDSVTVRTITTAAENYLPEGIHGLRLEQQQVSGLLVPPAITVTDENGESVPVSYNEETGCYAVERPAMSITPEEQAQVQHTLETYAKYMIKAASLTQVKNCCVPNSQVYYNISKIERWMQSYLTYSISPITYSDFYRYSDDLFSIRTAMTNSVTRKDGSVKDYEMDYTLFFTRDESGKWLLSDMTQVDTSARSEQVRLTFMDGETQLDSFFVDVSSKTLELPTVTAPKGQTFSGWVRQEDDGNGKITLTIMFAPDENGNALPPADGLEPMVLHALFEKEDK